jgi:hypothetical protein
LPQSQISWPKGDEFEENNLLIIARHPLLIGAFGTLNGLNLAVQTSGDPEIENATYNAWLHEHFISCIFAWSAKGVNLSRLHCILFYLQLFLIKVKLLHVISMHQAAGMMPILLIQFMTSYMMQHWQVTI